MKTNNPKPQMRFGDYLLVAKPHRLLITCYFLPITSNPGLRPYRDEALVACLAWRASAFFRFHPACAFPASAPGGGKARAS